MKKQKGITLIALVITIVVLLILATVTITAIKDKDKGIVTKAKDASQKMTDAKEKEIQEIYIQYLERYENFAQGYDLICIYQYGTEMAFKYEGEVFCNLDELYQIIEAENVYGLLVPSDAEIDKYDIDVVTSDEVTVNSIERTFDINSDGSVNAQDSLMMKKLVSGASTDSVNNWYKYDLNADKKIDSLDSEIIKNEML